MSIHSPESHLLPTPPQFHLNIRSLVLLAAIDDDVLWPYAALQHAHLGVVAAATEQAWRLDAEVGNALLVVVHDAEAILLQGPLVLLFDFLQARRKGRDEPWRHNKQI